MKLSKEEVQKIADLARIELKENEVEKYRNQLSDILGYVDKLQEVKTEGAEKIAGGIVNSWRDDEARDCGEEERRLIFENMPAKEGNELKTIGIFKK